MTNSKWLLNKMTEYEAHAKTAKNPKGSGRKKLHLVRRLIKSIHKQCTKRDYDVVIAIAGDEGKGKTHLELHILEMYLRKLLKECKPEDVRLLCLDKDKWKKQLSKLGQYMPLAYDEAGELTNRRSMSKFNVEIGQLFRVIRGNNNFMLLTIQSIFDLDSFFTKRRLKGLFYVNKRGQYYFYTQERLRALVAINAHYYVKNYFAVMPAAKGIFPKYKGVMLDAYLKEKARFIKESQAKIAEEYLSEVTEK